MALRVFILGGGRFGAHLASRLCEFGSEVTIADQNAKRVEDLSEEGFHAVQMDADDATALKAAGIRDADVVVVSIGENMQGSILATLLLKELKVKKIIARAVDLKHAQVLEKLGADLVVQPSRDMAWQLAETLRSGLRSERIPVSGDYQLAHVRLNSDLNGQTLAEAKLAERFQITVVLVSREKADGQAAEGEGEAEQMQDFEPKADFVLQADDWLTLTGRRANIDKFEREYAARV